jgi:hypothetical protein
VSDPLSELGKNKKKASLPAPEKISTHFTKSKPSSPPLTPPKAQRAQPQPKKVQVQRVQAPKAQAQKVQPQRVQAPQVKSVQAKQKQQLRAQQAQTQAYNPNDFKFHTSIDYVGINILIKYQDVLVHQFVLPAIDYDLYQRMNSHSYKYEYVKAKVNLSVFWNDAMLVHSVIKTIINVLDMIFAKAREIQAQANAQAQARRRY